jgi:Raf kinase inhibitor-like YbhB/YbcL family protein
MDGKHSGRNMRVLVLVLVLGAALATAAALAPAAAAGLTVTTPDFANGGAIPPAQVFNQYGCHGQNRSPALSWSGEPAGTRSFAVTMYDPDALTGSGFWHWTAFNIPASVHGLAADAGAAGSALLPTGAGEGRNDFGLSSYSGPCPPPGDRPHRYQITVYAVKVPKLPLDANSSGALVGSQLRLNALATGQIVGLYGRAK